MHVLIICESFPPETKSASTLYYQLAESLVKKNHRVTVVTRMPKYNLADGATTKNVPRRENLDGIDIHRLQTPTVARNIPLIRGFEHFLLAFIFFWGAFAIKDVDVILVYSPPLPLGIAGHYLGKIKKTPVVVNVQDLIPQGIIDIGLLKNKFLIKLSKMMERFVYQKADYLTVPSDGHVTYLLKKGAAPGRAATVHNWVDVNIIKPAAKTNAFSQQYKLGNKFIVSFAGTIGFGQGLSVVIEAAEILRNQPDILFVLVGDGVEKKKLQDRAESKHLNNVLFIPTQPVSIYPQILHASDVCLVTLRKELTTPTVPGKLASILAAGKAVITSLPLGGDTPKIVDKFQCGICVKPDDSQELAKAVLKLYNNRQLGEQMGLNGRRAAEQSFSRDSAVFAYEEIFQNLLKGWNHV
ncbi:MAG: glycosyltransferase family 4 protein [Candidatus Margulisbacteria bacterium]|nr:glycosyltransferase family 4 protein [Candidatus Margulisiibacteriota bacterium]MBU1022129.1 glycosyltransferase family 4 protein [Candidatus Margulisiibacteriota bacterium]MBU1728645.1 glycosyltransferase family 4 protein [Candidatus Margulisiibacteriota bacterium]MBU1955096.1 glycosyltransferase family 4 protein [Candidatus Margulisiibacteriota bacterium]